MRHSIRFFAFICMFSLLAVAAPIDPALGTLDENDGIVWYDGTVLPIEGKGWTDTKAYYHRLPSRAEGIAPSSVWGLSQHSAGLALRFTTDAPKIKVRWTVLKENLAMPHMPATGVSGVDLYGRDENGIWRFIKNGRPHAQSNSMEAVPFTNREHLLYLPLYNGTTKLEIGIPKGSTLSTAPASAHDRFKPVAWYGTSICQGGCASRPGLAHTAVAGRIADVPIINLGFSGSGKMEPEMADFIAELDPALFVLDCLWNMTPELVEERIVPFVKRIRESHPDTPILLAEDSNYRNISPTEKGTILRQKYELLKGEGDENLYFLPNTGMLGEDYEGTVDNVHPNDIGMLRMGEVFGQAIKEILETQE